MAFVAVVLGWPAVIASIVLTTIGINRLRRRLVLAGAVIGSPFLLYLFLTPRFHWIAAVVWILYFGAVPAVARRSPAIAWILVAPFVALAPVLHGWSSAKDLRFGFEAIFTNAVSLS